MLFTSLLVDSPEIEQRNKRPARQSGGIALTIENISKTFQGRAGLIEALQPVNIEIKAGEFVCLLGPSGCGKSTLLGIIAGIESADGGAVFANGEQIRDTGTDRVLLFQEAALFPWLDVQGNVEFGLRQTGMGKRERAEVARHFLALVHLQGFERSYIHQLSGGMRQRVALARALALKPSVLLMDEPFSALDSFTRDLLHQELEAIWQETGQTIVFVTHNVREAVALGDRVLLFAPRPGRLVGEFRIRMPRPRSLEDAAVVQQTEEIMAALRQSGAAPSDEKE